VGVLFSLETISFVEQKKSLPFLETRHFLLLRKRIRDKTHSLTLNCQPVKISLYSIQMDLTEFWTTRKPKCPQSHPTPPLPHTPEPVFENFP
jgi:hypothetical protein